MTTPHGNPAPDAPVLRRDWFGWVPTDAARDAEALAKPGARPTADAARRRAASLDAVLDALDAEHPGRRWFILEH